MLRVEILLPFLLALFLGSIMDPDGRPKVNTGDSGSIMDPNG